MAFVVLAVVLLGIIVAPGIWVKRVISRYAEPADRYSATGAALARFLLDARGLESVPVELTEAGDHYDPVARVVRLTAAHHDTQSLAAIVIAAHEVGHAVQHAEHYTPLTWRTRLAQVKGPLEKLGALLLVTAPVITLLSRVPVTGIALFAGGFLAMGTGVVLQLITLPTELDASFNRALPMLKKHEVLIPGDEPHAHKLLKAAALTYVAAALASLLNVARWWAILRR